MSVLIVDDASIMRIVIKDTLMRYCNYEKDEIYEASGGADAKLKYQQIKPELVFCDISMPDINGVDLVKELIEIDPEAKIIMCTASAGKRIVKDCINAGALDYVVKPPSHERIMQAIEYVTGDEVVRHNKKSESINALDYSDDDEDSKIIKPAAKSNDEPLFDFSGDDDFEMVNGPIILENPINDDEMGIDDKKTLKVLTDDVKTLKNDVELLKEAVKLSKTFYRGE